MAQLQGLALRPRAPMLSLAMSVPIRVRPVPVRAGIRRRLPDTSRMTHADQDVLIVHGPREPAVPLVLDSPHSGVRMPPDFGAALSEHDLRDGEDCYIDELYKPAAERGIPLLAAQFPRTYLDPNRHHADIDLALLDAAWPHEHQPSGKDRIGKALIWRTLDDGRPIYARRLGVDEVRRRIERYHRPYHDTLRELLDAAHARFGTVVHLNCHSMNAVSGLMGEGGPGVPRADFVLGDRDGTSCDLAFTHAVRDFLKGLGYRVAINDPYKGVELVRRYSSPSTGRHSLQIEIARNLYMNEETYKKSTHFNKLKENNIKISIKVLFIL